jgi:hypothetical protein
MINAKELRIGNLVQSANGYFTYEVTANDLIAIEAGSQAKPIPLKEESLLKLGFTKNTDYYAVGKSMFFYKSLDFYIIFNENNNIVLLSMENEICVYKKKINIKYVHQLQNLYFALTGEEL